MQSFVDEQYKKLKAVEILGQPYILYQYKRIENSVEVLVIVVVAVLVVVIVAVVLVVGEVLIFSVLIVFKDQRALIGKT